MATAGQQLDSELATLRSADTTELQARQQADTSLDSRVTALNIRVTALENGSTPPDPPDPIPPIPPIPPGTNEPAGYTPVLVHGFDVLPAQGWSYDGSVPSSKMYLEDDPTAPLSPGKIGVQKYNKGMGGGGSPAIAEKGIGSRAAVYVKYAVKLSPNFVGHGDSEVNKQIFLWSDGRSTLYTTAQGRGSGLLLPEIHIQGSGGTVNYIQNIGANKLAFSRGVWHLWEMQLISNTNGAANGIIRAWLDGVEFAKYLNVRFNSRAGAAWTTFQWSPTWGGIGETVPADQFQYLDHIYISAAA